METFWLKRLGQYICHIALRGHMAEGDLLLLGTLPCKVVGQINVLGALSLDGIVENGEGCCVVCVKLDLATVAVTASPHLQVLLQFSEPQRFCNEGCCC